MSIESILRKRIAQESLERQSVPVQDIVAWIETGRVQAAIDQLVYFTPPRTFVAQVKTILGTARDRFDSTGQELKLNYLRFLADLYADLCSSLPRWNLQNVRMYPGDALSGLELSGVASEAKSLVEKLARSAPTETDQLLGERRKETAARFQAEASGDPQGEAMHFVGDSIAEYLDHLVTAIDGSNVRRIAEMRFAGVTTTEVGNDYAGFLPYALMLGASFVTCNPVLVEGIWAADRPHWDPVVDKIIAENPEADDDRLAQLFTLEVVLTNMLLLRPIFLVTEGSTGVVCLQVNPHKHGDAAAMITEALFLYEKLEARVGGGVPNLVFKLPGTKAGLEACRALTGRGFGVTITVNFGMFQHLCFAQAIQAGRALFSCLVEMNGRLAFPVRDELLARLDELARYNIDESKAREAAAWAGVAVVKRLHKLLREHGYDLTRVKPLIASLRVYEGTEYADLPSPIPDITETLGASIISIFPDIRRVLDARAGVQLDPRRVESPVPEEIMATLAHSEIFRQAYYVADPNWLREDDDRFRPASNLTLDDEAGTAAWAPVDKTLTQFCKSQDTLVQRIKARQSYLKP